MAFVKLARGSSAAYFNINRNKDTVYFLKDNPRDSSAPGLLYLGDTLIGSNIKDVLWNSSTGTIIVERYDPSYGPTSTTITLAELIESKINELASGKVVGHGPITVTPDASNRALIDLNIDSTLKLTPGQNAGDASILGVNSDNLPFRSYIIRQDTINPLKYVLVETYQGQDTEVGSINIPEDQFLEDASVSNGHLVLTWKLDGSTGPTTTSIPITDFFNGIVGEGDRYIDVSVYTAPSGSQNAGKEVVSVSIKQAFWDDIDSSINNAVSVAVNDLSTRIADLSTGIHNFLGFDGDIGTGEGQFANVKAYVDTKVIPGGDELEKVRSDASTLTVSAVVNRQQNIEVNVPYIVTVGQGLSVVDNKITFSVSDIVESGSALSVVDGKITLNWIELDQ